MLSTHDLLAEIEGNLDVLTQASFNAAGQLVAHRMVTDEIVERMQLGLLPEIAFLGTV